MGNLLDGKGLTPILVEELDLGPLFYQDDETAQKDRKSVNRRLSDWKQHTLELSVSVSVF